MIIINDGKGGNRIFLGCHILVPIPLANANISVIITLSNAYGWPKYQTVVWIKIVPGTKGLEVGSSSNLESEPFVDWILSSFRAREATLCLAAFSVIPSARKEK